MRDDMILEWAALKVACYQTHGKGPGGAALCACGAPCGGSHACSMLRSIRGFFDALELEETPVRLRPLARLIKEAIH